MAKSNRDDFSEKTKTIIAKRAGWLCSFPTCRVHTVGATSDDQGVINIGTAAHICAAAPGGPRYDEEMSFEERSSAQNGIWMCRDHGKAIDSTDSEFSVERLRDWKRNAENDSWQRVLRYEDAPEPVDDTYAKLLERIQSAATADLEVFKRTAKWPSTSVALTLLAEGFDEPITTNSLAKVVQSLDDLILIAPPGMGKTTTLFQIAEGILSNGNGTPLVVPLGDWATENLTVLDSILKRPAMKGVSEDDIRNFATRPGIVILLDGWNELNSEARNRARSQIDKLKAELPMLGFVVSTRKQVIDVPFEGTHVNLQPLNEDQQMQIAKVMRGDMGERLVDQAWRTAGVRELITIPLYLTTLLLLNEKTPFPSTKEEVLRQFVSAHEKSVSHAEALQAVTQGLQRYYLEGIAVFLTRSESTAISENEARSSISATATWLNEKGQITNKPEPGVVLDVLVSNHMLMRTGDTPGFSFQHQQFQEWYASYLVERQIVCEVDDPKGREALKAKVLNLPVWEEAIFFAVERLSRGNAYQIVACGKAILAAFEVDPILAADMIFRSTDEVWMYITSTIQRLVASWHAPGKVDRALRFMLTSGRSEFLDIVWPLITDENNQVSLNALRNCKRFRSSILGKDAEKNIRALSQHTREVLLDEIAVNSGMDGLDLASTIAKDDPNPEVQASVVEALALRRANRHIVIVLQEASDATFDIIAQRDLVDDVGDKQVKQRIIEARERQVAQNMSSCGRLREILYAKVNEDRSAELTEIISSMEINQQQYEEVLIINELRSRYPDAVSKGLLDRVLTKRELFYRADDILASAGFHLEDDALLQFALAATPSNDLHANAAASVLGPQATGAMIDELLDTEKRLRDADGNYDQTVSQRYNAIRERIAHVPGTSIVAAVQARSAQADNNQIEQLARILSRQNIVDSGRGRQYNVDDLAAIRAFVEDWGNRMLNSGNAKRREMASIATLASQVPDVGLLPLLKRMLDDNLYRYRKFREEAEATGLGKSNAMNEALSPMTDEYKRAFLAINTPETASLMYEYLANPYFGELAACVLASQWKTANEPPSEKHFSVGLDFSHVKERRVLRDADLAATSSEAENIFAVINQLIADGTTDDQKRLATELGIVAVLLPHGQRDETIKKLIALTHRSRRCRLLLNLIFSGEVIDCKLVADGITETFEAAKKEPWIITQGDGFEWREWLQLLPFTNHPAEILQVVRNLPEALRHSSFLEGLVHGLAVSPSEGAEEVFFKLAEEYPCFYQSHQWRASILKFGTESAALRLTDLIVSSAFDIKSHDAWHFARELGVLLDEFPKVRRYVYGLLKGGVTLEPLELLARAVSENPDTEGLLLMVDIENKQQRALLGSHSIENVVTEHIPEENWSGAYNIVPVHAIELRQKLLSMTTDGSAKDAAARCLNHIDSIRDQHGLPISEPRHPDLASGKLWPIMTPDPDATAD